MCLPVVTIAQMREWEKATWETGQTESEVIRLVGKTVANRALQLTRRDDLVIILAGKGNNGADARAAREHLLERRVDLLDIKDPQMESSKLDALLSLRPALIIDGLFGIGINRTLSAEWTTLIQQVNDAHLPVLAVDIPSGLNADTGEVQGAAIQASVTLCVGAPKQGLLNPSAWPFVGRLEVASNVGLIGDNISSELKWILAKDFMNYPSPRLAATHKGNYGHLAIIAGSMGYHGAAVLAARGAQRAQPGLITLHTMESVYHSIAPQTQAVMVSPWLPASKVPGRYSGFLIGPGLAAPDVPDDIKVLTRHLWRDSLFPIIMDASALDWVPMDPAPRNAVRVLTPHPAEAGRLLRWSAEQVQANRLSALRQISRRFSNSWVVLKGHQTLIGRSTGEIYVNSSGNPYLAQGGSGDLLSGYLAGLLSQPELVKDVLKTITFAVWHHGAAADDLQASRKAWTIEDLANVIGTVGSNHRNE
jgi:ADP-dependent NAD(P)H-hydrate dehydratase / NAD(P)H-hydrate epimerase